MVRALVVIAMVMGSAPSLAAETSGAATNIVPAIGEGPILVPPRTPYIDPALPQAVVEVVPGRGIDLTSIARIGAKWGRVTSIHRTPEHNRRVGGVPNSFHLSGRAIDIARKAGVSHAQIAASLRAAGFSLLESLDEGDHSHFAFGGPGEIRRTYTPKPGYQFAIELTTPTWKVVTASGGAQ